MSRAARGSVQKLVIERIRECERTNTPWTLESLANELKCSRSAVNYHLMSLRASGVLREGVRLVRTTGLVVADQQPQG